MGRLMVGLVNMAFIPTVNVGQIHACTEARACSNGRARACPNGSAEGVQCRSARLSPAAPPVHVSTATAARLRPADMLII
jgi:hypothetical protein